MRINSREIIETRVNERQVIAARINSRNILLSALEFDSFATELTVGPLPFWGGGPTGTVQSRDIQYKSGFAFKANVNLLCYGARIWNIVEQAETPTDHVPKLCISNAVVDSPVISFVTFNDNQPTFEDVPPYYGNEWRTVMFDSPVAIPMNAERVIFIVSWVGSNLPNPRNIARSEGGVAGEAVSGGSSLNGLMQALEPQGWFTTNPPFEDEMVPPAFGRTDAWYWIDPLVIEA